MVGKIERYGRECDEHSILKELPVIGVRTVNQNLYSFFVPHKSNKIQLTYVYKGIIDFIIDGEIYSVNQGEVIVNKPGQVFSTLDGFFPKSKTAFCKIDLDGESEFLSEKSLKMYKDFFESLSNPVINTGVDFYNQCKLIMEEHKNTSKLSEIKCQMAFNQLMLNLIESSKSIAISLNSIQDSFSIDLINEFVDKNISRKIYVSELADLVDTDVSQLKERFEALLGLSICKYIQNKRIEHAKKLMLNSKESITSIAFELGFSSSQYFSNQFKEVTGLRPRAFLTAYKDSKLNLEVLNDKQCAKIMDGFFVA